MKNLSDTYLKLVSKYGLSMKSLIAIQRKLLELTYALCKTKSEFDEDYSLQKNSISSTTVVPHTVAGS